MDIGNGAPRATRRALLGTTSTTIVAAAGCVGSESVESIGDVGDSGVGVSSSSDRAPGTWVQSAIDQWPMVGRDPANTSYNPDATGVPDDGELYDRYYLVGDEHLATEIAAFDDALYWYSDGELYVRDIEGNYKWREAVGQIGYNFDSHPAVDGERVYISSNSEEHFDHVVALPTGEHSSQEPVWSQTDFPRVQAIGPTIIGDTLWIGQGSGDEALLALDAESGEKRRAIEGGEVAAEPAIRHGNVYASIGQQGEDPKHMAFDAETGEQLWVAETPAGSSAPIVGERLLFYGGVAFEDGDGIEKRNVVALDAETGEREWATEVNGQGFRGFALADGTLYVPEVETELYALDAETGAERWTADLGSEATSKPSVANGVVYVGAGNGHVYALDAETGEQRWRLQVKEGSIGSGPIVVGERVFVDGGVQDRGLSESYTVAAIE
jgi:outer membrane protein assembly factor BamB